MRRWNRWRLCRMDQSKHSVLLEMVEAIHGDIVKHLRFPIRPENLNFICAPSISKSEVQAQVVL